MVLLYSKGALIFLRANSSGEVVFSYVYVICFSFDTGSDDAEQGEEQGQPTGCLSFFSFSSQTSVRPLADISPLQTPFFFLFTLFAVHLMLIVPQIRAVSEQ